MKSKNKTTVFFVVVLILYFSNFSTTTGKTAVNLDEQSKKLISLAFPGMMWRSLWRRDRVAKWDKSYDKLLDYTIV